jgi:hypothetical protein
VVPAAIILWVLLTVVRLNATMGCASDIKLNCPNTVAGHAGERPDDSCSEASDLSKWEEPECCSAGSDLSEWGDSENEADVPQEPSLQAPAPEPGNDTRAGKQSKMAEMLLLGQLDTRAKSDKVQSTSNEVRLAVRLAW